MKFKIGQLVQHKGSYLTHIGIILKMDQYMSCDVYWLKVIAQKDTPPSLCWDAVPYIDKYFNANLLEEYK